MTLAERIAEIEKRLEEATPGPWWTHEGTVTYGKPVHGVREHTLCTVDHEPEHEAMFCSQDVRDGHFIACARTDIPYLLARIAKDERLVAAVRVTHCGSQRCCGICEALADYEKEPDDVS